MCKCNNGKTELDFQTLVAGGTAANATYIIGLTQYVCGNRRMPIDTSTHPVVADLKASVVGAPVDLQNGTFCCEVQLLGTMTYRPCGCCEPKSVFVNKQFCVPCSSLTPPTLTLGNVVAVPEPIPYYDGCCQGTLNSTNRAALTMSLNVTTGA